MAKKGQEYKNYSAEYKLNVIMDMREHRLGYVETARKYDIPNYRVIQRWERIFLEEGAEGLMKERRGRACAASGTKKGRPPKLDPKVEEDLIAENQRLRMENEYLKKLDALVREREERESARKQK
jgi:transposase